MKAEKSNQLKVGDIVTHTGKRGFWPIDKSYKGVGLIMSELYKQQEQKYVHDVWFVKINQVQQIGAGALERINDPEENNE